MRQEHKCQKHPDSFTDDGICASCYLEAYNRITWDVCPNCGTKYDGRLSDGERCLRCAYVLHPMTECQWCHRTNVTITKDDKYTVVHCNDCGAEGRTS